MKTSDQIAAIADALSKAQAEMTGAKKDKSNPFFRSTYADLSAVMEAISKPFAAHGLSFAQSPGFVNGMIEVQTRIMHSSGEWIEGSCVLPPTKSDAQGYGSAITYAKRYGLQAMAGIPSIDDDGNAAVAHSSPVSIDTDKLFGQGEHAASLGMNVLQKWWQTLAPQERKALGDDGIQALKEMAK